MRTLLFSLLSLVALPVWADPAVHAAASRFVAGTTWLAPSVMAGDFSCEGRQQHAILGYNDHEIVVAVFLNGMEKAPQVLRFANEERQPQHAKFRLEALSLTTDEIKQLSGSVPPGYQASKTCQGLRLSDDAAEAAHIYWDHNAKHLDSWAQ